MTHKILPIVLGAGTVLTIASPVLAKNNASEAAELRQEKREEVKTKLINRAQTNADREIDRRVNSLEKLISHINGMKKISADQKATLVSQVQAEIDSLKALKTKIDSDTDVATLKADKKSIVDAYRVFVVFMPKVQIMANGDKIIELADQMTTGLEAKVQLKINEASASGKDVTTANAKMADGQAKLADAKTQAQNAINMVASLDPAGYPGNKATLQQARNLLQTARKDLVTAMQDFKAARVSIK
jgi:hypothetical protein